jgi:dTDP-4-amino-4,6-dideoxygalactose transaminase
LTAAAERVIASGQFILGPEVAALERDVAALCGVPHAVGVSSGSDALLATLMALGVGPGDEVVTPALSFIATPEAVVRLGARPVFVDVGADFNISPAAALDRVGRRTRAILAVDLFGRRAPITLLGAAGVAVVEDAAQAIGTPALGHGAAAATLSFFPSKNLGALGDGGMVLTHDALLAERVRLLRVHGAHPKYVHAVWGGNFRLDALQAALLRVKLPHLERWNQTRRASAERYLAGLDAIEGLVLPPAGPKDAWHQFVVRVRGGRRDALRAHLAAHGVDSEVYYPLALHLQPCFTDLGGRPGDCPNAETVTREALALPIHAALTPAQVEHVMDCIRRFFRS